MLFNTNFKHLRKLAGLSMNSLAIKLSALLKDKEITIPQIQSYEGSSSAKYDVLIAIRNFYREYDPNLTTDDLLSRDLKNENYTLPEEIVKEKLEEDQRRKNIREVSILEELVRARQIIMDQAETIYYLTKKIETMEK